MVAASNLILTKFPLSTISHKDSNNGILEKMVHFEKSFKIINRINTIFIPSKEKKVSFFSPINKKEKGFFLEILFHGLNFNAKRVKLNRSKYFVDVHKSEVFICDETIANSFKSRVYKRRLIFFSYNEHLLNSIKLKIKEFRLPDIYTGKGLFSRNDLYKTKPGKIRQK